MAKEVGHGEEEHQDEQGNLDHLDAHDGVDVAVVGVCLDSPLLVEVVVVEEDVTSCLEIAPAANLLHTVFLLLPLTVELMRLASRSNEEKLTY